MTSRERVEAALKHKEPDRIPNDFSGTIVSGIHIKAYKSLVRYLGLEVPEPKVWDPVQQLAEVDEAVRQHFQTDCVPLGIHPPSTWTLKIRDEGDCYTYVDEWGTTMRMSKRGGHYFEFWRFPIERPEDVRTYRWPDPTDPARYRGLRDEAKRLYEETEYALCGAPLFGGGILEQATRIMRFDRFLALLGRKSPWADRILGALTDLYAEVHSKTQAKLFFHTDGAIRPLIPDLIEVGVDILQPVQVSARGMSDTAKLKREFGKELTFWGASCDSQHTLPFGTPEEVREETRRHMEDLKPGGGYVFAPIHNIQPGVPPENIVAMYEVFFEYRDY